MKVYPYNVNHFSAEHNIVFIKLYLEGPRKKKMGANLKAFHHDSIFMAAKLK